MTVTVQTKEQALALHLRGAVRMMFGRAAGDSRAATQLRLQCASLRAVRMHVHHTTCASRGSSGMMICIQCTRRMHWCMRRKRAPAAEHAPCHSCRDPEEAMQVFDCGGERPCVRRAKPQSLVASPRCSTGTAGRAPAAPRSQAGPPSRASWARQLGCEGRRPARAALQRRAPCVMRLARLAC